MAFHNSNIAPKAKADKKIKPILKPATSTIKPATRLLKKEPKLKPDASKPCAKLALPELPIKSSTTIIAVTLKIPAAMPSSTSNANKYQVLSVKECNIPLIINKIKAITQ